jgi:hypothetical protein
MGADDSELQAGQGQAHINGLRGACRRDQVFT